MSRFQTEQKFAVFLWDLIYRASGQMSGTDLRTCQDFILQLQSWGMTSISAGDLWEDELKMLLADMEKQRQQYEKQNDAATHRLVPFFPYLASNIF